MLSKSYNTKYELLNKPTNLIGNSLITIYKGMNMKYYLNIISTITLISMLSLSSNLYGDTLPKQKNNKTISKEQVVPVVDFKLEYRSIMQPIYKKYLDDNKTNEEIDKDLNNLEKITQKEQKDLLKILAQKEIQNDIMFTFESLRSFDKSNKYIKAFMEDKTLPEMTIDFDKSFLVYWEHKKMFYEIFIENYLSKNNSNELKYQLTEKGLKKFKYSYVESMKFCEYEKLSSNLNDVQTILKIQNNKSFWEYFKN